MADHSVHTLRLDDRGYLRVGAIADIAVLDGDRIRDRATDERPRQPSEGTVNGRFAVQDGDAAGALAGPFAGRSAPYAADLCPAGRLLARCAALVMRVAGWLYRAYPSCTLCLRFGG